MLRTFVALLILLSLGLPAVSSDYSEQIFTCPVDGKMFKTYVPVSGTSFGYMLDFEKIGPFPSPWAMPVCPGNGFVMYDEAYAGDQIGTIRTLVKSPEFATVRDCGNQWLTAAFEMRQLGAKPSQIANMYLSATWAEKHDPAKYRKVAEEAHAYLSAIPDGQKGAYYLVLGELERRLGRFDAARKRFTKLPHGYATSMVGENWKRTDLALYIKRQLHFIAARNSLPQAINPKQEFE